MTIEVAALFIGLFALIIACISLGYQFGKDIHKQK